MTPGTVPTRIWLEWIATFITYIQQLESHNVAAQTLVPVTIRLPDMVNISRAVLAMALHCLNA